MSTLAGHSPSSPVTWLKAYSFGVAFEMPQAAQSVERFHAMQLFAKATDQLRCEERQALTATNYVWLKREGNLTERQRTTARPKDVTAEGCEGHAR